MTEKIFEILKLKQVRIEIEMPIKQITSSFSIAKWLMKEIGSDTQENLVLFCLDTKNCINAYSVVHKGTLNQSIANPRDIFQRAILTNSANILVAHNHPSSNTTPSTLDNNFTQRLIDSGKILGIDLLDHIIVSADDYYSYREEGFF